MGRLCAVALGLVVSSAGCFSDPPAGTTSAGEASSSSDGGSTSRSTAASSGAQTESGGGSTGEVSSTGAASSSGDVSSTSSGSGSTTATTVADTGSMETGMPPLDCHPGFGDLTSVVLGGPEVVPFSYPLGLTDVGLRVVQGDSEALGSTGGVSMDGTGFTWSFNINVPLVAFMPGLAEVRFSGDDGGTPVTAMCQVMLVD